MHYTAVAVRLTAWTYLYTHVCKFRTWDCFTCLPTWWTIIWLALAAGSFTCLNISFKKIKAQRDLLFLKKKLRYWMTYYAIGKCLKLHLMLCETVIFWYCFFTSLFFPLFLHEHFFNAFFVYFYSRNDSIFSEPCCCRKRILTQWCYVTSGLFYTRVMSRGHAL